MQAFEFFNIKPQSFDFRQEIALILTLIGIITTVFFHISLSASNYDVKRQLASDLSDDDARSLLINSEENRPKKFFKCLKFYQVAFLYIFARLFMTTALVFIPEWVASRTSSDDSSHESHKTILNLFRGENNVENIATVPLASFIASFVTSIISKQSNRFIGHKFGYFIGTAIGICGCVWIALEPSPSTLKLYLISIIYGAAHSMLIIASLSMTADFIGSNSNKSGSIYSAVTFFDKLLTGIAIFVIEAL